MALDFPNAPTNGQAFTGPNSAVWVWNSASATWDAGGPSLFLPLSGGTMTGAINALDPTTSANPVTLGYFNTHSSAVTVGDVAPTAPTPGSLWWSSAPGDGQLYLYYADPNTSQWVVANHIGGGPYLALAGGTLSGALTLNGNASTSLQAVPLQQLNSAIAASPALNDVGRNTLHNALFNIQQRGIGPWTTLGYGADRWVNGYSGTGGSCTMQLAAMTAATAAVFNDEAAQYNWQATHTAGTGAGDNFILRQYMENVRRFSGKTMTLSFWAWCASGTPKVCAEFAQQFGTGGSPSVGVTGIGMTPITISTTPTRYSVTFTMPSVAGKTFGTTAGSDFIEMNLWMSAGSTYSASRAGGIGFQSGTFLFWGIQLEIGSTMTPLEKVDPGEDLRRCQRFYQIGDDWFFAYAQTGATMGYMQSLPVAMRATPTIVLSGQGYINASGLIASPQNNCIGIIFYATVTSLGSAQFNSHYTLSADL